VIKGSDGETLEQASVFTVQGLQSTRLLPYAFKKNPVLSVAVWRKNRDRGKLFLKNIFTEEHFVDKAYTTIL